MTSLAVGTTQVESASVGELVVEHLVPLVVRVGRLLYVLHGRTIAKVSFQGIGNAIAVGTRGRVGIVHLYRHTAIQHQIGNSLALNSTLAAVIAIAHIGPINGCTLWNAIDVQLTIDFVLGRGRIGWDGSQGTVGGLVALIVHNLCHGSSDTSRHGLAKAKVVGAVLVVGVALVPLAGHQLWHLRMLLGQWHTPSRCPLLAQVVDLVLVLSE